MGVCTAERLQEYMNEELNHESEIEMIFKVQYDHQYEEDLAVLFPKKEEFTLDRMVQDIAHYKEYQRKLNSKHSIHCE